MPHRPLILRNAPLLEEVPPGELEQLSELVTPVELEASQTFLVRGQPSPGLVLVEAGALEVLLEATPICSLSPGSVFSEESLLFDAPSAATLRAAVPSLLGVLERRAVDERLDGMPHVWEALDRAWRHRVLAARLYSIDLFRDLSPETRSALADAFETVDLAPGATLAAQGRALDCLYVVREGQAELALPAGEVVALRAGDCVGELGLVKDFPQPATVTAPAGLRAMKLTRAALSSVLGRFDGASAAFHAAARKRGGPSP
ncbi:MAG TPA: cyclic nucleotide-binding domain-containing protein [Myxococcales bacterium]|nr:cyclic nucleotide-binding domain-containing protein [Myxococcales bacterium]